MSDRDSNGQFKRKVERAPARSAHESGIRRKPPPLRPAVPRLPNGARTARIERIVREHLGLVWRVGHHLGLQAADAEDVGQQVMVVASRRLDDLVEGKERAFLVRATLYIADKVRRARRARPEVLADDLSEWAVQGSEPDEIADRRRALVELDRVLERLPEDLRKVLVLFEVEGFSQSEIGETLQIPQGTVASRIRRAKVKFLRVARRSGLLRGGLAR